MIFKNILQDPNKNWNLHSSSIKITPPKMKHTWAQVVRGAKLCKIRLTKEIPISDLLRLCPRSQIILLTPSHLMIMTAWWTNLILWKTLWLSSTSKISWSCSTKGGISIQSRSSSSLGPKCLSPRFWSWWTTQRSKIWIIPTRLLCLTTGFNS